MGKKFTQSEIENKFEELISNLKRRDETLLTKVYLERCEEMGYNLKKQKEKLDMLIVLNIMSENYFNNDKKYNLN